MKPLSTPLKIENKLTKLINESLGNWTEKLISGDLYGFEKDLKRVLQKVEIFITKKLLDETSEIVYEELKNEAVQKGCSKIISRPIVIKTATGATVKINSPYVKKAPEDWNTSRHLLINHWTLIGKCSPLLYDKVSFSSVLCPSYNICNELLMKFGVKINISAAREITNNVADFCFDYGEEKLLLKKNENLSGKVVAISTDGGRTRTRQYNGKVNDSNIAVYETPWREPKLFVIDVIDENGEIEKYNLPIYGCRFGEKDMLALLEKYLVKLGIQNAKKIQIIADGAPWIWNNLKPLLLKLNVNPESIVETLDYYHASQYIHDLVKNMPKRVTDKEKKDYLKQFKELLWTGKSDKIIDFCKQIFKRPNKLIKRWINYLDKHQNKTQYTDLKDNNLLVGSGIIESAVRRIINLRFKNASSFWDKDTVEKLYCLRAAVLSKRWNTLIHNIVN